MSWEGVRIEHKRDEQDVEGDEIEGVAGRVQGEFLVATFGRRADA